MEPQTKKHFITNDREDEAKPSSMYCYVPGEIGRARYKAAEDHLSQRLWWQYSIDPKDRDALAAIMSGAANLLEVSEGTLGEQRISVKHHIPGGASFALELPKEGWRAIELKQLESGNITLKHIGHWIEANANFRMRENAPQLSLEKEQEMVSKAYDELVAHPEEAKTSN